MVSEVTLWTRFWVKSLMLWRDIIVILGSGASGSIRGRIGWLCDGWVRRISLYEGRCLVVLWVICGGGVVGGAVSCGSGVGGWAVGPTEVAHGDPVRDRLVLRSIWRRWGSEYSID